MRSLTALTAGLLLAFNCRGQHRRSPVIHDATTFRTPAERLATGRFDLEGGSRDLHRRWHGLRLRARIRGALNVDLDWKDAQARCGGDARPDGSGLRLSFAGPGPGGKVMHLVFGGKLRSRRRRRQGTADQPDRAGGGRPHAFRHAGR